MIEKVVGGAGGAGIREVVSTSGEIESRLPFFAETPHRINEIAYGLESLCDNITGPVPCEKGLGAPEVEPENIIAKLDMATNSTQTALDRLQHAANRLRELI